jgi:hypothetical protein
VKKNELLTSAAKFRQQCDAEDEESDAFRDLVVRGMGRTQTGRCIHVELPDGAMALSMAWNAGAGAVLPAISRAVVEPC